MIRLFYIILSVVCIMLQSGNVVARAKTKRASKLIALKEVRKELKNTQREIASLNIIIKNVEQNLGLKNKKFLLVLEERKRIETIIVNSKEQLEQNELVLSRKLKKSRDILKTLVLKRIQDDKKLADMMTGKLLIKTFLEKVKIIKREIDINQSLISQIKRMEIRFHEYIKVEEDLRSLLYTLEEEKRLKSELYYEKIRDRKYLKSNYKKIKNDLKNRRKKVFPNLVTKRRFIPPVNSKKLRYKNKGKGIYFGYSGKQNVHATAAGKIVYTGDLSTYGKLIMIDHGKGLRSVILGQFSSKVKKGMTVNKKDIIGITSPNWGRNSEIYFEVRRGSKVQNTSRLITKI